MRPGSRIDVPTHRSRCAAGPLTIAGVAWAPPAGVRSVEVSIDDGDWLPAQLAAELAPTAWRQWRHEWHAAPGEHRIHVRAISGAGAQPERPAPPYPEGAAGYHEVRLWVHDRLLRERRTRQRIADGVAEANRRLTLAAMAPPAWIRHGYPRRSDFPDPAARRPDNGDSGPFIF